MSFDELSPLFQQLIQQPTAFLGGVCAGFLRLKLTDDPVKNWLEQQMGSTIMASNSNSSNGNGSRPRSISID
jgi:hypothetical protein